MIKDMVSVIVPIFNMEPYLEQCLASIQSQTYHNLDIICVNACSKDNSAAIVKRASLFDDRVRLVNQSINDGLGGSRNEGLKHASGEYVLFVDSDDWIESTMIETLVGAMIKHDVDYAFGGVEGFDEDSKRLTGPERPFHSASARKKALSGPIDLTKHPEFLTDVYPSAWIGLRRHAKIRETQADFPTDRLAEDHRFHYIYGLQSRSAVYLDQAFYKHRRNRHGQLSADFSNRILGIVDTIAENFDIFDRFLPEKIARAAKIKICIRLIYEKLGQVTEKSSVGAEFFMRARKLLSQFGRDEIYLHCDAAIRHRHLQEILGETISAKAIATARDPSYHVRELFGSNQWGDIDLDMGGPIDFRHSTVSLAATVDAKASCSLRLALLCDPISESGIGEGEAPQVLEYRQTFEPSENIILIEDNAFMRHQGRPDIGKVRRIYFGGEFPSGKLTLKLFLFDADGNIGDLVGRADQFLAAHDQIAPAASPQEEPALSPQAEPAASPQEEIANRREVLRHPPLFKTIDERVVDLGDNLSEIGRQLNLVNAQLHDLNGIAGETRQGLADAKADTNSYLRRIAGSCEFILPIIQKLNLTNSASIDFEKRVVNHLEALNDLIASRVQKSLDLTSTDMFDALNKVAMEKTVAIVERDMRHAILFTDHAAFLRHCLKSAAHTGAHCEFGVYSGWTVNVLAETRPDVTFDGFDSFEGLPEDWSGFRQFDFNTNGSLPDVKPNVRLHHGWFNDTLPAYAESVDFVSFAHIDCDIYSSTKMIFDALGHKMRKGTVLVFDELFFYPSFEHHEYKAFSEFLYKMGFSARWLAILGQKAGCILTD